MDNIKLVEVDAYLTMLDRAIDATRKAKIASAVYADLRTKMETASNELQSSQTEHHKILEELRVKVWEAAEIDTDAKG